MTKLSKYGTHVPMPVSIQLNSPVLLISSNLRLKIQALLLLIALI